MLGQINSLASHTGTKANFMTVGEITSTVNKNRQARPMSGLFL